MPAKFHLNRHNTHPIKITAKLLPFLLIYNFKYLFYYLENTAKKHNANFSQFFESFLHSIANCKKNTLAKTSECAMKTKRQSKSKKAKRIKIIR